MARPRGGGYATAEANIWPAVTDSILLMASIFIVMAVISLVSVVQKVDDEAGSGDQEAGEKIVCSTKGLKEEVLFGSGKHEFKDLARARSVIKDTLSALKADVPGIRREANQHKEWNGAYFLVLEVSGHADLDPNLSGTADGNWLLSAQRAVTVANELESILRSSSELQEVFEIRQGSSTPKRATDVVTPLGKTIVRVASYSSHLPYRSYPDVSYVSGDPALQTPKQQNRRVELRLYAQPEYLLKVRDR